MPESSLAAFLPALTLSANGQRGRAYSVAVNFDYELCLAQKLKQKRLELHLGEKRFADLLHVSRSRYGRFERYEHGLWLNDAIVAARQLEGPFCQAIGLQCPNRQYCSGGCR